MIPEKKKRIRFIIIDQLNNTKSVLLDDTDNLLLQKETYWISTHVTMHKDLKSTHDWNKKRRTEHPK